MPDQLAQRIHDHAHLTGEFRLRSGTISNEYFDKYRFESDPLLLREIAQRMMDLLPAGVDLLAGLELGGIPIATTLSQLTGLPTRFVRKAAKEYGTRNLAEGGDVAGQHLVIVEDVVTSGGQIIDSATRLRDLGARVSVAICVIDREAGGAQNLSQHAIELRSLFTAGELTIT